MRMTYDPQADAAQIVLDFDAAGRVLVIEVLRASETLAPGALASLPAAAE